MELDDFNIKPHNHFLEIVIKKLIKIWEQQHKPLNILADSDYNPFETLKILKSGLNIARDRYS